MVRSNITAAVFPNGLRKTTTSPLWQYDYGQLLTFPGLELPTAFECHFSNEEHGTAVTQIGSDSTVTIPDAMFLSGAPIYAWIFLHTGEDDGETEYMVVMPILKKSRPSDAPPTPVEQTVVTQAIAALDAAVEQTGQDVENAAESAAAALASEHAAAASEVNAAASEINAAASASAAQTSAEAAAASEINAAGSEANAAQSAEDAAESADRAEQAATTAGYMFFYIDERGHLIYQRTENVNVDFYLNAGHLYVKAVS